jgi:DNA-binding MarR family transcriptional regulator
MKKTKAPDTRQIEDIASQCLLSRTRSIARVITGIYDQSMRPHGVNASQFAMLVLIAKLNGASRAELGRANHQERSTSTRNLQLLLDQGWVEEVTPEQGRSRPIYLSAEGKALLSQALPAWRAAQEEAQQLLGEAGAAALHAMAQRLPAE